MSKQTPISVLSGPLPTSSSKPARRSRKANPLTPEEVSLIKAMLTNASLQGQDIVAYFTRPGRTVNQARITDIRSGKARYAVVPPASAAQLKRFFADWPQHDYVTGLHPVDDELVVKAREAMMNAVQSYNNPRALFRSECFIVLAIIAWTYLLHWYFGKQGIDYRARKDDAQCC